MANTSHLSILCVHSSSLDKEMVGFNCTCELEVHCCRGRLKVKNIGLSGFDCARANTHLFDIGLNTACDCLCGRSAFCVNLPLKKQQEKTPAYSNRGTSEVYGTMCTPPTDVHATSLQALDLLYNLRVDFEGRLPHTNAQPCTAILSWCTMPATGLFRPTPLPVFRSSFFCFYFSCSSCSLRLLRG